MGVARCTGVRGIVLGVVGVLAGLGVLDGNSGGRAAFADPAIDTAADIGVVIGHGPLPSGSIRR